jgi:heptosyltransferase-2
MTEEPGTDRIIRAPNHLGDVVLALPALAEDGSDVIIVRPLAPLLEMAGVPNEVIPLDRGAMGFARATRELRSRRYRSGVLLSAAFSAAWLFRCGGVQHLRGTRTDGRGLLLRERIEPGELRGRHRIDGFRHLLGLGRGGGRGWTITPPRDRSASWRSRLGGPSAPLVGLFPGANAPARRWPAARFGEVARGLTERGARIVVLGGAAERPLTKRVTAAEEGAIDLGGETDLVDLAAVLSLCDLVITNDTGPMHLAGAVGTPTVSLWGSSDPGEVSQAGAADIPVTGADLPCRPCRRNHCHRRGRGTLLADAHEECMRLIDVDDVVGAATDALARRRPGE